MDWVLLIFAATRREELFDGLSFWEYCSPVSSHAFLRQSPPGLAVEQLPSIDAVLISHCHYDHLDRKSLRMIERRRRDGAELALICRGGTQEIFAERPQPWHRELGSKRSIAMHWGTFALADDSLDEAPRLLRVVRSAAGLTEADFSVPRIGGMVLV